MTGNHKAIGIDRKLLYGGIITVAGLLFSAGISWIVGTTVSHGNRIAAIESGNVQVRSDLIYIRARIDEVAGRLLGK